MATQFEQVKSILLEKGIDTPAGDIVKFLNTKGVRIDQQVVYSVRSQLKRMGTTTLPPLTVETADSSELVRFHKFVTDFGGLDKVNRYSELIASLDTLPATKLLSLLSKSPSFADLLKS